MDAIYLIGRLGLVPSVVIEDADRAIPTAEALAAGGLPIIEVALPTEAGLDAVLRVRAAHPDFVLGVGGVLTPAQCQSAIEAGASYIASPGLNERIVLLCREREIAVFPGCATPTEIDKALSLGLKAVRVLPAACESLYAPFASAGIRLMLAGGVGFENIPEHSDKQCVYAVVVDRLADASLPPADIALNARRAIDRLLGFEMLHVGINLPDEAQADRVSDTFLNAFGFEKRAGSGSIFSGAGIEVLKGIGRGAMGHIAVRTNSVERAVFHLERRGFSVDEGSIRFRDGAMHFAYLKEEIGGFAVHLIGK